MEAHAQAADGTGGHRISAAQTVVILVVLVVLTVLEVAVAMSHGPGRLVTVSLFVLAIAQAAYFALVAMGLRSETRSMKKLITIPLGIAAFYSLILVADAAWRALGKVSL